MYRGGSHLGVVPSGRSTPPLPSPAVQPFVLVYYGNTGSSWLLETISGTPAVLGPAFQPLEAWAWDGADEEKLRWIRSAFSPPDMLDGPAFEAWVEGLSKSPQYQKLLRSEFQIVGFKMSPKAVRDTEHLLGLLAELSTRLVLLSRTNRIKHALSLYRYFEEEKSQFERQGVRPPSTVRMRRFGRWVQRSQAMHEGLQKFSAAPAVFGPGSVARVAYEEFVTAAGKAAVIERLAAFLGIDPGGSAPGSFEKVTPDDLRAAVAKYERLRRRYRNTPLSVHFDD